MGQTSQRNGGERPAAGVAALLLAKPRLPGPSGLTVTPAADRRADGQHRTVALSRDCVCIDRRLAGIAMRVTIPIQAYRGVTLSLLPDAGGVLHYALHLLHHDADLSVVLDCTGTDADILADWRLWSRFFRLPALVERQAGMIEAADLSLGGLPVGKAGAARRRPRFRSKRRPSFLARRKTGDLGLTVNRHGEEREIIART